MGFDIFAFCLAVLLLEISSEVDFATKWMYAVNSPLSFARFQQPFLFVRSPQRVDCTVFSSGSAQDQFVLTRRRPNLNRKYRLVHDVGRDLKLFEPYNTFCLQDPAASSVG